MKLTKLSLAAVLAVSAAVAGGDITPTPVVEEASKTTINGKLTGYYITDDAQAMYDIFDKEASQLGFAATLDVSHRLTDWMTLNFSAIGYMNAIHNPSWGYMESNKDGAFFNVANATFTFADTTFIAGRQLLDTPMLGGFDWLLAPGAFEAYTFANKSFDNITLVGSYVRTWRPNNSGDNFIDLTDIDDGNNWTLGAAYDNQTIRASVWFYNVDAGTATNADKYTQIYVDAGYNFGKIQAAVQYANTNYDIASDSDLYGIKVAGGVEGISFMAAYANVSDNTVGFIGRDTVYTSSWNTFTSTSVGDAYKIEANSEFAGISASASYAYYEYENETEDGHEIDVILGYNITNAIDINAVYSNTDYGTGDDINALEIYANYKF